MKEIEAWVARDKDGELHIFPIKPEKFLLLWHMFKFVEFGVMRLPDDSLPEIKWSDKEPTKVKITIERCK